MLDLCCCEGIGAWGYWRSGRFSEIVGIDLVDYSRVYPFDFIQGDALALDYDFLMGFDFIHASPNCQGYSKITPDQSKWERSIPRFHTMLYATGKPYVIENVEGSSRDLKPNLVLSGFDVGLPMARKRYFHLSWINTRHVAHNRQKMSIDRASYVHGEMRLEAAAHLMFMGLDEISARYLSKVTMHGLEQGIPAAMTRYIANLLPGKKLRIG